MIPKQIIRKPATCTQAEPYADFCRKKKGGSLMKQTHRKHTPVLPVLLPLLLLGSGCGNSAAAPAAEPEESPAAESAAPAETAPASEAPQSGSEGNGTLIVYFSRTGEQYQVGEIEKGNTEIVAEMIAEKTGADLYEILPEADYYPYTYDELTDVAKKEQNENARPAYQDTVPDLSQYSTVFIGAPVWWGDWPMIMYTFFE